jgi:hypothetical protein
VNFNDESIITLHRMYRQLRRHRLGRISLVLRLAQARAKSGRNAWRSLRKLGPEVARVHHVSLSSQAVGIMRMVLVHGYSPTTTTAFG